MKSKKIIAGVLSFAMMMTSIATPLGENASDLFNHLIISSEAATEDISPLKSFDDIQVGYSYKGDDRTYSFQFTYNDGMFISDADEESSDLAKVSVSLAMSAYNEETIHSCLENMGFSYTSYNYSRTATYDDNDFVAYTIANKQVTYNGEEYNVFIVPIRGTSGNCEWFSNFNMGSGSNHTGFYTAANEVMTSITNELAAASSNYDKDHTIVLTTGHSRGAAVANIVAGKLSCTSTYRQYVTRNHIFGYNFACPAVSKNANTNITNIRNYNNPGDVIAALPLSDWGFRRFGVDCELDMSDDVFQNFEQRFKSITGEDYAGLPENDSWVFTLKLLADSQESYNTNKNRFIFGLVAAILASSNKSDFFEYAKRVAVDYPLLSEKVMINILLPELWKFTTAVNATQDLVLMSTDSYKDLNNLLIEIDNALSDTAGMDSDEFKSWLNSNSSLISSIKNKTDIEVDSRSDLVSARNDISDQMQSLSRLGSDIETLFNLFYQADGIGNLGSAIFHAHTGETYILWINSMFYGYNGWANNKLIKKVTIPDGIIRIDNSCFSSCIALEEVTIPDTAINLGSYAFHNCTGLTKITMPVDIDYDASTGYGKTFYGCTNVKEIRYTAGQTKNMTDFGTNMNSYSYSLPHIAKENLKTVSFDEGIAHIGNYAFYGCSALSTVKLPSTVTSIGNYAFHNCSSMSDVYYTATQEEWDKIDISDYNTALTDATIHFVTSDISNCTITIPKNSYEYTGSQIKPKVTITNGENTLVNGTDYVIRYADNIEVGTASIIIAGRGNYSGKVTYTFEITETTTDISNCTITIPKNSYEYTGSQIKPKVTITDGENTLVNGTDYVIRYADNIEVGTASIIIAGRGNYSGKVTKTFEITEILQDIE